MNVENQRDVAMSEATTLLESVKKLKENNDFLNLKTLVLDKSINLVTKRIELSMKNLVNDIDGKIRNSILQDQGMLSAFKRFADLDDLEKLYKAEVERLKIK